MKQDNSVGDKLSSVGASGVIIQASTLIKQFEGLSLISYKCPADVWTIGHGNTSYLKDFEYPEDVKITQEKAEELLSEDVQLCYNCVMKSVRVKLTDNQIVALISFVFNLGQHAFINSTLLQCVNKDPNDFNKIQEQFMRWNHVGKDVLPGLTNRRQKEFDVYQGA